MPFAYGHFSCFDAFSAIYYFIIIIDYDFIHFFIIYVLLIIVIILIPIIHFLYFRYAYWSF